MGKLLGHIKQSLEFRNIITWMLHQIFMYSNKVIFAAGYNNSSPQPLTLAQSLSTHWMNELTNKEGPY